MPAKGAKANPAQRAALKRGRTVSGPAARARHKLERAKTVEQIADEVMARLPGDPGDEEADIAQMIGWEEIASAAVRAWLQDSHDMASPAAAKKLDAIQKANQRRLELKKMLKVATAVRLELVAEEQRPHGQPPRLRAADA
jgi:hypothetical protein